MEYSRVLYISVYRDTVYTEYSISMSNFLATDMEYYRLYIFFYMEYYRKYSRVWSTIESTLEYSIWSTIESTLEYSIVLHISGQKIGH